MATVTGLTAERMIEMENATVVAGEVIGNNLILETRDGSTINAGIVTGPIGPSGASFIVCTSTTRPVLTAGEQGKAIYETDTKLIRVWIGTRWKLQERVICTSSTRPFMVITDEGVKIYETDTDSEFVWSGTSWLPIGSKVSTFANTGARNTAWPSPPNGAQSILLDNPQYLWTYYSGAWRSPAGLGFLHYEANSFDVAIPPSTVVDVPLATYSFTPISGRYIKVTGSITIGISPGSTAAAVKGMITNAAGTVLMARDMWMSGNGVYTDVQTIDLAYIIASTGAPLSFKLRAHSVIAGTNIFTQDQLMIVEDIGGV